MNATPITKRPWFYIAVWLIILVVVYGWQIFRMGGVQSSWGAILFDLFCLFPLLLIMWMAFFAQFVLPVRTYPDRRKAFDRLLTNLSGGHGPALSIENGEIKEHSGERFKRGPGVIWLDTASAAVTRTPVKIKQTLGPGVHFVDRGEFIAGTVDLHIQNHTLGPKENDDPFADEGVDNYDEFSKIRQERRKTVSALTRDGIEIVPNISIMFRVDTGFPAPGEPGSRFGYRTGITRKAKADEEKDKEAIRKAILGEGVNPTVIDDDHNSRRVAWNELPASLAVDIWREYASKFTLDDLFKGDQVIPPAVPLPLKPLSEEFDPLSQPVQVSTGKLTFKDRLAKLLREVNVILSRSIRKMEGAPLQPPPPNPIETLKGDSQPINEPARGTALQVINQMVNARLQNPKVFDLDDHGVIKKTPSESFEYQLLMNRGIRVLSVTISNIRFRKDIEEKIIKNWSAAWLKNAKAEQTQIDRRLNIIKSAGQEKAILQFADLLSREIVSKKPNDLKDSLKVLLLRTRSVSMNLMRSRTAKPEGDSFQEELAEQQQKLEDILRWVEAEE